MSIVENQIPQINIPKDPSSSSAGRRAAEEKRLLNIQTLTLFVGIVTGMACLGLIYLFSLQLHWQLAVLALLNAASTAVSVFALRRLYPAGKISTGFFGIYVAFNLSMVGTAALLAGMGFPVAIVSMIFSLILSSETQKDWQANLVTALGIVMAGASALLNDFSPFVISEKNVDLITPAILGALFMIYVSMMAMQFVSSSLRTRLVTSFMAIVIFPLVILSAFQSGFMFDTLSERVTQSLQLASQQTAGGIDKFLTDSQIAVQESANLEIFQKYLNLPANQRLGSAEEQEMKLTLTVLDINESNSSVYLSSFALLDINGNVVYDTLPYRVYNRMSSDAISSMGIDIEQILEAQEGDESRQDYFLIPARTGKAYISPVKLTSSTKGYIFISAPVIDSGGKTLGVVRARYDAMILQDMIKQYNGLLGADSYAMLLDENNIRLADGYMPQHLYRSVAPLTNEKTQMLQRLQRLPELPSYLLSTDFTDFNLVLNNYKMNPIFTTELGGQQNNTGNEIGAITELSNITWKVVYLQTNYSDAALRREQRQLTTLVTTLLAVLAGVVAVGGSQLLSSPIARLTQIAESISEGNLEAKAPTHSSDEFGMLGSAFNLMTGQLRNFINELEDRVRARTKEIENQNDALANRARQLQTVSDVARQIVSSQDLEKLLTTITQLISERFDFYHVGIFLLDENKENAVLRAANSDGGQRMLARHHSLPIGRVGIVGFVTGVGEARIATDVGDDAVFFNNPDLPNTRSEMALPLKVGDQTIGALDIQSIESNAFHTDDIELFTTLADQVAIAIYNNVLYVDTLNALNEAQKLHRQYLQSEWIEETAHRKTMGYLYNQSGVVAQQSENPLWKKVFASGEPVYANLPSGSGTQDRTVMAVPIAIRGETIGVIHVQDQGDERLWSEDEVTVVNSIANQVAVALENARLFENTVRRAEREKKVLQITAKIRSTNNPEEMMQIAISELQQALHASRTQIYIRQEEQDPEEDASNKNGRKGKPSSHHSTEGVP